MSQPTRAQRATPGAPGFVISDKPCHPDGGIFFNQNEAVRSFCPAIKKSEKTGWAAVLAKVSDPWTEARLVEFHDYENRLLLASRRLESATAISRTIRNSLRELGSSLDNRLRVRNLKSV